MQQDLIRLIVAQLQEYDLASVARVVAQAAGLEDYSFAPSARLADLVALAQVQTARPKGWDFETSESKRAPLFASASGGTHKAAATCGVFSADGRFAATGSTDSIRVLDILHPEEERVLDCPGLVGDIAFHPINLVLAACSDDTVRFFDVSKTATRRSFRLFSDSASVNSISFHPCGMFLSAGTNNEFIRLYDVRTSKCFSTQSSAHDGGVLIVRMSPDGKLLASAGGDGSVRIWDAIRGTKSCTIRPHGGDSATSLQWSHSSRYLLSCGRDNAVRLWDASSGKCVKEYLGTSNKHARLTANFSHNEDFILSTDELSGDVVFWDSLSGDQVSKNPTGHSSNIVRVACSPESANYLTYDVEGKFKLWEPLEGQ